MDANSNRELYNPDEQASVPDMVDVRRLTEEQFAQLGLAKLAYVKPVIIDGTAGFAIHAADGTPMALAPDRDLAMAAIVQHEMVAALVH
jgi:hypothetical protein